MTAVLLTSFQTDITIFFVQVIGGSHAVLGNKTEVLQSDSGSHSRFAHTAYICVDKYARFIGSIGGIILSLLLLGVWLGLGKLMGFNNSNWWLIIGTYPGLVSPFWRGVWLGSGWGWAS